MALNKLQNWVSAREGSRLKKNEQLESVFRKGSNHQYRILLRFSLTLTRKAGRSPLLRCTPFPNDSKQYSCQNILYRITLPNKNTFLLEFFPSLQDFLRIVLINGHSCWLQLPHQILHFRWKSLHGFQCTMRCRKLWMMGSVCGWPSGKQTRKSSKKCSDFGLRGWKSFKICTSCHKSFEPKQPRFAVKCNQPKTAQKPLFTPKSCEITKLNHLTKSNHLRTPKVEQITPLLG